MTKEQFLSRLNDALINLPTEEQNDILNDYVEYFNSGMEDGKTDQEIATALGSPDKIGKELTAIYHVDTVEGSNSSGNFLRALWAVLGLGFFNLVIVLAPFIVAVMIVLSGWLVVVSFILSPLGVLINTVIYPEIFEPFNLFFSVALAGAGLLISIIMLRFTNWFKNLFIKYFKFNIRMVKGGMKNA